MMLTRGEYFRDAVSNSSIKNLEDIRENVHFRDNYARVEETSSILTDTRFAANKFSFLI